MRLEAAANKFQPYVKLDSTAEDAEGLDLALERFTRAGFNVVADGCWVTVKYDPKTDLSSYKGKFHDCP